DQRGEALAQGLGASITLGVGQFCTNPGVVLGPRGPALDRLTAALATRLEAMEPGVMLYGRLCESYAQGVERARAAGATLLGGAAPAPEGRAAPAVLATDAARFLAEPALQEEVFGPASIVVAAGDATELERAAEALLGQLTASIHGTEEELAGHARLIEILQRKAGRLIFNGFPTGVEVGHAMQHGGPYPASTDSRTTSVGSAAIERFARPVCFQDFPDVALPPALRRANPLAILRLVNGAWTRDPA
ncbi:MAG TPA: aldehyde dehydrogenase family protein, partial [Longimicrobiales bacterium]